MTKTSSLLQPQRKDVFRVTELHGVETKFIEESEVSLTGFLTTKTAPPPAYTPLRL